MPPVYELDSDPEIFLGNEDGSESSELPLDESVSFIRRRPTQRPRKKRLVSRTFGVITMIAVIVILVLFLQSSPASGSPEVRHLESQYFQEYNSKRVQIKYGPYEVPSKHINNGMKNFVDPDTTVPCHDCLITWMQADLVYPDGNSASADTGMWLHHTVLANSGKEDIKGCEYHDERFFASGNERTLVDISMNGTEKSGYWLASPNKVFMLTELMNEHALHRTVFLTITFEYIPYLPSGFNAVTPIWLDIGGCESEMQVPADKTSFHFHSPVWTSTINGRIICILGHLHDGGTHLDVKSDDQTICRSMPEYDGDGTHIHDLVRRHGSLDMSHISQMSICHNVGKIGADEKWTVTAYYDIETHLPMLDAHGDPEEVMGIAIMYVVES